MNEWNRIFSDKKRRNVMILLPVLCLILFFYQKSDGHFENLIKDAREYQTLLDTYQNSTPDEIIGAFSNSFWPTPSEQRIRSQAEYLKDYPAYLEQVQKQASTLQKSSLFKGKENTFSYRNVLKTAEDFSECSADQITLGNDRAMIDWLSFSLADWAFLAAILLLIMAFQEERKKGLAAVIHSCPNGRVKLQVSRLIVLLVYSAVMTVLLYALPLVLSLCLDGGWEDLSRPIQSLAAFQKYTVQQSITAFLTQFFIIKVICGFLLGILLWFFLIFVEQIQLSWMLTTAGLAVEYLLYAFIPAQSIFSVLRSVNVFSYVFTQRLYTQYLNLNFFSQAVSQRSLLLGLLAVVVVVLSVGILWTVAHRYPFGNRSRMEKWIHWWNRAGDCIRSRFGLFGFEWYKLLFLTAGGLFMILSVLMTQEIQCSTGNYNDAKDGLYRQYLAQIQGPVSQATYDYIADARLMLENSDINTGEFDMALDRLEETISQLDEGDWIVDQTQFLNVYGSKAWLTQRINGLLALLLMVMCLSPLYTCEQNGDVRKVLGSAPGGRGKLFGIKYAVALIVTFFVWLLVFKQEWTGAKELMGDIMLMAPCSSIDILGNLPMTVGTFLTMLYIFKGLAMLIPMQICIFIGERSTSFEKAFVLNGVVLLVPAAVYAGGVDALRFLTPSALLSDGPALLSASGLMILVIWAFVSLAALLSAHRHWCKPV